MAGDRRLRGITRVNQSPPRASRGASAKPMSGESGMPMNGSPSSAKPSSGSPSSGQPSSGQPQPKDSAQENVEQAVPPQKGAQEDIDRNKRDDASKQDQAIQRLSGRSRN